MKKTTTAIVATLAALAHLPQPSGPVPLDGINLVPVLKNPAARVRDHGIDLLIVHGDADGFFPLDHPRALHEAAPGSELWIEPGFGHAEGAIEDDLVRRMGAWAVRPGSSG